MASFYLFKLQDYLSLHILVFFQLTISYVFILLEIYYIKYF